MFLIELNLVLLSRWNKIPFKKIIALLDNKPGRAPMGLPHDHCINKMEK